MAFGWFSRKAIDGWSRSIMANLGCRNSVAHWQARRRAGSELRHIRRPPSRSVQAKVPPRLLHTCWMCGEGYWMCGEYTRKQAEYSGEGGGASGVRAYTDATCQVRAARTAQQQLASVSRFSSYRPRQSLSLRVSSTHARSSRGRSPCCAIGTRSARTRDRVVVCACQSHKGAASLRSGPARAGWAPPLLCLALAVLRARVPRAPPPVA